VTVLVAAKTGTGLLTLRQVYFFTHPYLIINLILYSFHFHQAASEEGFIAGLTPLNVYVPLIGKWL
jgi:hypothetical protein